MDRPEHYHFKPHKYLTNGDRMTLFTWARPRYFPDLPSPTRRLFDVAPGARVLAHCHWQSNPRRHPTVLVLHGLEGSSQAHYMRGIADKAFTAGLNVVLLNQRNCGNTEHLSKGLYHSGLTDDPEAVLQELIEVDGISDTAVIGYSLGGNVALKLGGQLAQQSRLAVRAICAVSPTIDLNLCVQALEEPRNSIYQWNFVRNLKRRMRRKIQFFPEQFDSEPLARIRSVRDFDEEYTAPFHGFRDADDYYHRSSSLRVIDKISIPTLIVSANDDPFVPPRQFTRLELEKNTNIETKIMKYGGHCGFLTSSHGQFDGYWAEHKTVGFVLHHCQ